ncbi:MAG: hypothetical protein KDB61_10330, partial [Planctomycetes bacterium]|nr:hypothetical protein [Planctomycetota bacterium]
DQVTTTGVSYGDVFATGDHSTLRTSIGLFTRTERLTSNLSERVDPLPGMALGRELRADELSCNGRITGLMDVGREGIFQWGLSAHSVPDFSVDLVADDGTSLNAEHLDQWVYGADLTFGWSDETEGPSWTAGWEGLIADGAIAARAVGSGPATLEVVEDKAIGQYLWLEHRTRSGRALGAVFSSFERPDMDLAQEREVSLYFARPLGERSQLRFQVSHRDLEGQESSDRLVVQWMGWTGRLGHTLDW